MTKPILLNLEESNRTKSLPIAIIPSYPCLDLVGSSHLPCFPSAYVPLANDFRVQTYRWIPIRFGERLRTPVDRVSCRNFFDSTTTCVTLVRMSPEALPQAFNRRVNTYVLRDGPYPSFLVRPIYDFRLLHLPAATTLDKLSAAPALGKPSAA